MLPDPFYSHPMLNLNFPEWHPEVSSEGFLAILILSPWSWKPQWPLIPFGTGGSLLLHSWPANSPGIWLLEVVCLGSLDALCTVAEWQWQREETSLHPRPGAFASFLPSNLSLPLWQIVLSSVSSQKIGNVFWVMIEVERKTHLFSFRLSRASCSLQMRSLCSFYIDHRPPPMYLLAESGNEWLFFHLDFPASSTGKWFGGSGSGVQPRALGECSSKTFIFPLKNSLCFWLAQELTAPPRTQFVPHFVK